MNDVDRTMLGYAHMYCEMTEKYKGIENAEHGLIRAIIDTQPNYRPWYLLIRRHLKSAECEDGTYEEITQEFKDELKEMLIDAYCEEIEELNDDIDDSDAPAVLATYVRNACTFNWEKVACLLLESYTYMREKEE